MLGHDHTSRSKLYKVMTDQQFDEVVSAILDGKYSWACMLILEFAGYNPLYYIPRRTYARLKKEHRRKDIARAEHHYNHSDHAPTDPPYTDQAELTSKAPKANIAGFPNSSSPAMHGYRTEIRDLSYLEEADNTVQKSHGRGIALSDPQGATPDLEPSRMQRLSLKISSLIPLKLW